LIPNARNNKEQYSEIIEMKTKEEIIPYPKNELKPSERKKSLIEDYITTPSFKRHVSQVTYMFDRDKRYIDDIIQDFCYYYLCRPEKVPNIRKLYNLMISKLRYEKRYKIMDFDEMNDDDFDFNLETIRIKE
jgi:hypothetical protein